MSATATATTAAKAKAAFKPIFVYEPPIFATDAQAARLLALSKLEPWRSIAAIAFDWVVIVGFMVAAWKLDHPLVWPLAVLAIGARQHALAIMMHEGAHQRIHPNRRVNELVADLFCAYPVFVTTESYRWEHLRHHFYLNTDKDPNWTSKVGDPDWAFPKSAFEITWLFVRELFGVGLYRILSFITRYFRSSVKVADKRPLKSSFKQRVAYYAVIFSLITYFQVWTPVLLLWFLPAFTVLPAALRLRVLCEHCGLEKTHDLTHSRNYHCNFLERFLFAPHNVWYHLDHHLFPAVPFYNLPRMHAILAEIPEFKKNAHESETILSVVKKSVVRELMGRA